MKKLLFEVRVYKTRTKYVSRILSDGKQAIALFRLAKEKWGEKRTFFISRTKAVAPPPGFRPKTRNHYWCPYCLSERKFIEDSVYNIRRCEICGTCENAFYFKLYNRAVPEKHKAIRSKVKLNADQAREAKRERARRRREARRNGG